MYQQTKNQFISLIASWDTGNFGVLKPEWPEPFLTKLTTLFFNQLSIYKNLYQRAKNQTFSSICSRDIANLRILQCDWPTAFCPISQEPDFFPNMGFVQECSKRYKVSLQTKFRKKSITKFSDKFKKPYFWLIFWSFSPFWGKKYFFRKTCLLWRTPYGPLTPCWVTENTIEPIPRKLPYGRTDRPLFIGPFQQQLGVQLKAKYIRMM